MFLRKRAGECVYVRKIWKDSVFTNTHQILSWIVKLSTQSNGGNNLCLCQWFHNNLYNSTYIYLDRKSKTENLYILHLNIARVLFKGLPEHGPIHKMYKKEDFSQHVSALLPTCERFKFVRWQITKVKYTQQPKFITQYTLLQKRLWSCIRHGYRQLQKKS